MKFFSVPHSRSNKGQWLDHIESKNERKHVMTGDNLIRFEASNSASNTIQIACDRRAGEPINRLLFSKFAEHLGRNIYNGMWAQVLQNSSFADWSFFRSVWHQRAEGRRGDFPLDRVMAACERGLACWWLPYGADDATYVIDWVDPLNSETSQRISSLGRKKESGVAQLVYLPLHRVRTYQVSFYARGQADGVRVSLFDEISDVCVVEGLVDGIGADWQRFEIALTVPDGVDADALLAFRVGLPQGGQVWLDQVMLFPEDHVDGFDPDVVRLIKNSKLPLLRYPGGNFVSGYHWQDGVGPMHKRPVRANPAWPVVEPNQVGTDEFMAFCRAVNCEPMICVNAGNGRPWDAAAWIEYCNGDVNTEYGAMRAANGYPEPYGVRYWEVGNELYGRWQVGHCSPEEYAERYDVFRKAMLKADPNISLIANGQSLEWNKPLVERKGQDVRSLSLHTLIGNDVRSETDAEKVYYALMGYTTGYDQHLRALLEQAQHGNADAKIAITELQVFTNVPHLPNNASQTESLFLAGIIHSALRQGNRVEMITHSALMNHAGGLRKQRERVYANPVHWVSHLYGNLPAARLVATHTEGETFDVDLARVAQGTDFPVIDAVAVLGEDGDTLILLTINRHATASRDVHIALSDFEPSEKGALQTISGAGYMAQNTLVEPDAVQIEHSEVAVTGPEFTLTLLPHSVNALTLTRAKG